MTFTFSYAFWTAFFCKKNCLQQRLLKYSGCACIFVAAALDMASRNAFLLSLLGFSLTLPFLAPRCRSQSDYLLSSGPGSGKATASGEVFLVAPKKEDCDGKIPCDTVSFYSQKYTTGLSDAIFYFLPGNHMLSQIWDMYNFNNVTLRGPAYYGEYHGIRRNELEIHGSMQVRHSEFVVVENVAFKYSSSSWSLCFVSTVGVTIRNVTISHCNGLGGIMAADCENMTITQSNITECDVGICVYGSLNLKTSHLYLGNIHCLGIIADGKEGIATFNHVHAIQTCGIAFVVLSTVHKRQIEINIFNSSITTNKEFKIGLCPRARRIQCIKFTRPSMNVSYDGHYGIAIVGGFSEALNFEVSVRIHNVTITDLPDGCNSALYVHSLRNLMISDTTIKSNPCTAIRLVGSTALLQKNILLTNNTAISGGGVYLEHDSLIVLDSSTRLHLYNNTAEKFGGGMYVDNAWNTWYCFVISFDRMAKPMIKFSGNRAYGSGQNVYGNIPEGICYPPPFNGKDYVVIRTFGNVGSKCNQTTISSDPFRVVPCDGFCVNTNDKARYQKLPAVFPGQDFSLTLAAIGQDAGLTPAIILFRSDDIFFDSQSPDMTRSIKAQCTTLTQKLKLKTFTNQAIVSITIADEKLPSELNQPVRAHIPVLPCPPGFRMSGNICNCTPSLESLATCSITNKTIKRKGYSWIYPRNDSSILILENCPFDYCNNEAFVSNNPSKQCNHRRCGILCGDCLPGHSLMLGSNECRNCTGDVWPTTPVVIVLVFLLAGVGLVAALIALNLTVSVGTMNGLLFFVNVVKLYEPIFRWDQFHWSLRYVISWFNLDLGIPTCFYSGMTACHKMGLQFAFPVYLLSLVVVIIVVCNLGQCRGFSSSRFVRLLSGKVSLLIGTKAVTVLATLLLLSYTKTLRITILILHSATVIASDCEKNESSSTCGNLNVWYVNGSMAYRSDCHAILFWVAVGIVTPFLILFTSFLLFFPLMEKHLSGFRRWIPWHMRLKPWYDAYGGPYKDEYRSWTGILLVVRCVLALFTAFENNSLYNINVLAWVCLFLVSLLSATMVYRNFALNTLEIIHLFCLLLTAHFMTHPDEESVEANVVLWIVFSFLLLITSYHIYHFLKESPLFQLLTLKVKSTYKNFCKRENDEEDTDDNCDANMRTVPSTVVSIYSDRYDELREPLLEPDP